MHSSPTNDTTIHVELHGDDAIVELPTLVDWLRGHRQVGRYALIDTVARRADPARAVTTMGDVSVVQLVVDATFQTANLVLALMAWRRACRTTSTVTVHRDGAEPTTLPHDGDASTGTDPTGQPDDPDA